MLNYQSAQMWPDADEDGDDLEAAMLDDAPDVECILADDGQAPMGSDRMNRGRSTQVGRLTSHEPPKNKAA